MTIVSLQQAQDLLGNERTIHVLDVRKQEEYDEGHLQGASLCDVTDDGFKDQVADLDPDAEYLVYCKLGGRSAKAVEILTAMGFSSLHDLEGGFTAWSDEGLPFSTD